jgi:putative phosphoribosyl transferase
MFRDRNQAGEMLARELARFRGRPNVLVLALPRGGVPVARVIADELGAHLDVFLVRKLGVPWQPELGFGAIAEGGVRVIDFDLVGRCRLSPEEIDRVVERERKELARRAQLYRGSRSPADVLGQNVILVDDGLATGSTMLAAVRALRKLQAKSVVVAVPVGPRDTCAALELEADEVVCLASPDPFYSVGSWYDDFTQVDDRAVQDALSGDGVTAVNGG